LSLKQVILLAVIVMPPIGFGLPSWIRWWYKLGVWVPPKGFTLAVSVPIIPMVSGVELLYYFSYPLNKPVLGIMVLLGLWSSALAWFAWRSNAIDKRLGLHSSTE
jgi:hypothetical protein